MRLVACSSWRRAWRLALLASRRSCRGCFRAVVFTVCIPIAALLFGYVDMLSGVTAKVNRVFENSLKKVFLDIFHTRVDKCYHPAYNEGVTRTLEQITEDAARVISIRQSMPDIADLAREAGVSRKTLYKYASKLLDGGDSAKPTPSIVNPATAQGYEVTTEAYRTTTHQGGV